MCEESFFFEFNGSQKKTLPNLNDKVTHTRLIN